MYNFIRKISKILFCKHKWKKTYSYYGYSGSVSKYHCNKCKLKKKQFVGIAGCSTTYKLSK